MPKKVTQARLLVAYGKHKQGETIIGNLAAELVDKGMADDTTPKTKPAKKDAKKAPATKDAGAAPENKGDAFKV